MSIMHAAQGSARTRKGGLHPAERKLDMRLPDLFTQNQWRALARRLGLSGRQAQVARLICRGCKNHELAAALGIQPDTVRMHRHELFRKLDVNDRVGVPVRLVLAWRDENP